MADGALTDRRNGLVIRGAGWLSAARAKTEDDEQVKRQKKGHDSSFSCTLKYMYMNHNESLES